MEQPSVSVIIPIYNGQKWIDSCLTSVINQDFTDFEVLLINDGSTDGTEEILRYWSAKDSRIIVYNVQNRGAAEARNYGLSKAKGKYVYFCDIDDSIDNSTLSNAYDALTKSNADMSIFGYYMEMVDANDNVLCSKEYTLGRKAEFIFSREYIDVILELWDKSLMYNLVNRLFKKAIIDKNNIRFRNMVLGEDMEFCSRHITFCNKVVVLPECYYHYVRERKNSVTSSYREDWFNLRLAEYDYLIDYFKTNDLFNENVEEFLNRRFLERTLGCIQAEMSKENTKSFLQKKEAINTIINNKKVKEAFNNAKFTSGKSKVMMALLKNGNIWLNSLMGICVSLIKENASSVFFKLKVNR